MVTKPDFIGNEKKVFSAAKEFGNCCELPEFLAIPKPGKIALHRHQRARPAYRSSFRHKV